MKNTRRILSLLLALMMLACHAVALADEEPVVIKIACVHSYTNDPGNTPLYQEIERRFNVKFEYDVYSDEAWGNRFTLMLAENNLPDMIWNVKNLSKADANKYGADGYFLNMADYLEYMPNFSAAMENNPSYAAFVKDEEGAIYGINKIRNGVQNRLVAECFINQDWLTRLNLEVPTTIDELYDVLVAFRDQDADGNGDPTNEIPLSLTMDGKTGARMEILLRSAFDIHSYVYNSIFQVSDEGKVYLAETTENWKAYVKYMHKLFDEKLLDNNIFVYSNAEYKGLLHAGNVGIYASWGGVHQKDLIATLDNTAEVYFHLNPFFGVGSEYTDNKVIYPLFNSANVDPSDVICADTKYPELLCQIVDFFFSEEGIKLKNDGVDGQEVVFEEGFAGLPIKTYPDTLWNDKYASKDEWGSAIACVANTFQYVVSNTMTEFVWNSSVEEVQRYIEEDTAHSTLYDSLKMLGFQNVDGSAEDYPNLVYTSDENRERATILTDITNYIATMKAAFITGEKDIDATWDEFLNTLKTMQLDRLLEIEQQAYDRYASNL